jgi:hypothetical protein
MCIFGSCAVHGWQRMRMCIGGVKNNSENLPQEPLTRVCIITEQKLCYNLVRLQSICVQSIRAND